MELFDIPLSVARLLTIYPAPWCICGGWAIDLFLGRVTRPHHDIDLALSRADQLQMQQYLVQRGWTLEQVVAGKRVPWEMHNYLELPVHTIWGRHPSYEPTQIELLLNEVDASLFRFRRAPTITLARSAMIRIAAHGLPILAPEIVLLYKASDAGSQKNARDFHHAWPLLNDTGKQWLVQALDMLYADHPWLQVAR